MRNGTPESHNHTLAAGSWQLPVCVWLQSMLRAHVGAIANCCVCVCVCVCVFCICLYFCRVEFLLPCMLLCYTSCHIYRPLVGLCSVTPQNFSISPLISPHAKSLLNSASSVCYTKDVSLPLSSVQPADIIYLSIAGNSNEHMFKQANVYWVHLSCQTMAGRWVTQTQVQMIAQTHLTVKQLF